ncbi:hypothetical protein VTJ49DRAFT_2701 [Mycothermus thermophilus]|uniref:Ribosomal protein L9 domain-containing protein n=1 Tax=Humicola insolens TaxID=85995 RepID=A0ABR3V981_HUMIN
MSSPDKFVRPLGPCEIYSSSRHALDFYKCVANTCQYSVSRTRLGDRDFRDIMETAVANVVLATPSLAVGIVGQHDSRPHFVRPPSVRMEHHIEYINGTRTDAIDSTLLRALERLHDQCWPEIEQRPPWKLIAIIEDPLPEDDMLVFDAIFAAHHAIADGRSTREFHVRLLNELNGSLKSPCELSSGTLNTECLREFPPPQEQLVAFSTSWGFLVQTLFRELGPKWLQRKAQSHTYESDVVTELRDRPSAAGVWTVAATLRNSIRQHLGNVPRDDIMSLLGWVTDWKKFWLSKVGNPRQAAWEVSNIGSMSLSYEEGDGPEQRDWKIQRSIMSQSAMVAGAAIVQTEEPPSPGGFPSLIATTMATPLASRSPTCLTCLRRAIQPFTSNNAGAGAVSLVQVRTKTRYTRPKDQGVVVRLLEDIPKFGRKDSIFRTERGRMRNEWYPKKQAEYMTAARFRELGLTRNDIGERDPTFGLVDVAEIEQDPEEFEEIARPKIIAITPGKTQTILTTLVPETLTFHRKPIPAPPAPTRPAVSPLIASGSTIADTERKQAAPLAIYGSVSADDIISYIKELLVSDVEGSRIVLEPEQIRFLGLSEDADRIKELGRFEIEISTGGTGLEPVRKVVEILPSTEGFPEAEA